jgi:hypothetical protein
MLIDRKAANVEMYLHMGRFAMQVMKGPGCSDDFVKMYIARPIFSNNLYTVGIVGKSHPKFSDT